MAANTKLSMITKMKSMAKKAREQTTEYIKDNPEKIEEWKKQGITLAKDTIDKETEKKNDEAVADQDLTKMEKHKAQALDLLKPQLDKLAANQQPEEYTSTDNEEDDAISFESVIDDEQDNTKAQLPTADSEVTDLVTNWLSQLDNSKLSKEEKKKAVNAFNAAFVLKSIL